MTGECTSGHWTRSMERFSRWNISLMAAFTSPQMRTILCSSGLTGFVGAISSLITYATGDGYRNRAQISALRKSSVSRMGNISLFRHLLAGLQTVEKANPMISARLSSAARAALPLGGSRHPHVLAPAVSMARVLLSGSRGPRWTDEHPRGWRSLISSLPWAE